MFLLRKRSIIIFLISFLIGFFRTPKRQKQATHVDPLFFAGTWYFKDAHNRRHKLEVGPDLKLTIDGNDSSAKVSAVNKYQVSYVDRYGYKLEIRANEARPVKFYDESDNNTYDLNSSLENR